MVYLTYYKKHKSQLFTLTSFDSFTLCNCQVQKDIKHFQRPEHFLIFLSSQFPSPRSNYFLISITILFFVHGFHFMSVESYSICISVSAFFHGFKNDPCCAYQEFLSLYCQVVFHCIHVSHFAYEIIF